MIPQNSLIAKCSVLPVKSKRLTVQTFICVYIFLISTGFETTANLVFFTLHIPNVQLVLYRY